MIRDTYCKRFAGFTLAELLIAVAILGEIAAFTIPKIISSQESGRRKAVLRETIATLSQLTQKAYRDKEVITNATQCRAYFDNNLNYVKRCATNPTAEGCWSSASGGDATNANAYVLPNGAAITSINGVAGNYYISITIDWNGLAGPNIANDDILNLIACLGPTDCSAVISGTGPKGPGVVGPYSSASTVFELIFQ